MDSNFHELFRGAFVHAMKYDADTFSLSHPGAAGRSDARKNLDEYLSGERDANQKKTV